MVRRFASSFAFVFVAATSVACGGSVSAGDTPAEDTGIVIVDGAHDTGAKPDSAVADTTVADTALPPDDTGTPAGDTGLTSTHEGGVTCGAATCTGSDLCCASGGPDGGTITLTCAADCAGSATIACTSPDNCGQNPCCTQISRASTTPGALCAKAAGDCVPKIDIAAQGAQTRLCRADADCTSGGATTTLNKCCAITYQGNSFKGCFDPKYALFASQVRATIVCP
jgi:hypothetical protein